MALQIGVCTRFARRQSTLDRQHRVKKLVTPSVWCTLPLSLLLHSVCPPGVQYRLHHHLSSTYIAHVNVNRPRHSNLLFIISQRLLVICTFFSREWTARELNESRKWTEHAKLLTTHSNCLENRALIKSIIQLEQKQLNYKITKFKD